MMSLVSCPIEPLIDPHSNSPAARDYPKPEGPSGIAELDNHIYVDRLKEGVGDLQFAYTCYQMAAFRAPHGNRMHYIGAWGQPRDQQMVAYRLQV